MFNLTQRRPTAQLAAIIALLAALVLLLTACSGGSSETKVTYTKSEGGINSTMTITAEGDDVTEQSIKSVINYKEAGIKDKAEAKSTFAPVMDDYAGVKGLTHKVDYTDTDATETLTVDYKNADLKKIAELTGAEFDEANKDSKVSFKETVATVEASGFKKKG
ncbi:YehR family protein [Leucobacter viscericola]|uniref:YehR family protein n=1 Tax=Leucobacter viscericola TaxID=2714935 RepID=A0A6G7XGQ9_9MICO|nr:DUF1307 domain-containing protein [Leucobacter viscericola]QIK63692.1 YehR family protein [Leucobacter viscericola]